MSGAAPANPVSSSASPRLDAQLPRHGAVAPEDVLRFARDGFVLIRDVLTPAEVAGLRAAITSHAQAAQASGHVLRPSTDEIVPVMDLLATPGAAWLVSDARIVEIARKLIGRDDLVYFGDSGVMVGGKNRGFHKDNTNRDTPDHPDWLSPYTLVRFGFYLDEHEESSGGLKVRRGSHHHVDISSGEIVDVPTRPGDLVVWSLRTTHSGFAVRTRGPLCIPLAPRVEIRLPSWLARPAPEQRVAAFLTFGVDDHHTRNFIAKHADTESYPDNYMYMSWLYSDGSEAAEERLRRAGVTLLRPTPDYGSKHGSNEFVPGRKLVPGRARADRYPIDRAERLIRLAGAATRRIRGVG